VRLVPTTKRGALIRYAIGAFIVISFTAAATAVAGLLQFNTFAKDLSLNPAIPHANVAIANPGNPQTLLLIGSDHRAGEPFSASNTDTMMLVRLDPNSSTINLLSIPRDLHVEIPQGGTEGAGKINSAYSIGGPNLLVKILKSQVFPGLRVNHIVDVNFKGFSDLVDAIGCVYTDVDHYYYNNTAVTGYSSIDIEPGYQKLCGDNQSTSGALAFVRFRHTDTDIVRNARQQDFLRWAKSQFNSSSLLSARDHLMRIFGSNSQTDPDLHTTDGLINLFNLVVFSAGHTVKQIPFPAIIGPCGGGQPGGAQTPCYVFGDSGPEHHAFVQFMTPTVAPPPAKASGPPKPGHKPPPPSNANLFSNVTDGKAQVSALNKIGLPVYYPKMLAVGSEYCSATLGNCQTGSEITEVGAYPRAYLIHTPDGAADSSYRMTVALDPANGEYYGVQGTTWQNPPILNSPTQTKFIAGKRLLEYFNGHKLSLVAWRTPQAVYWVSNTLTDTLSNSQMEGIAASFTRG
jgi:polyisoprenyl-teichoic acid--peptidoglycan teichoic acid transferase